MKYSITVFFFLVLIGPLFSNIIHVRQGTDGDGSSWNAAFGQLTFALQNAQSGDTILISAGTYYPTTGNDRTATFNLPDNIYLRGGYATTGTPTFSESNPTQFFTTLSGNIGDRSAEDDNALAVVTIASLGGTITLDGVIISDGNAILDGDETQYGAGILFQSDVSTAADGLRILNCNFINNRSVNGGAIYTLVDGISTQITVRNCEFKTNTAAFGAALHNEASNGGNLEVSIQRSEFVMNESSQAGGAIANYANGGNVLFVVNSSAFIKNRSVLGGAIYNFPTDADLTADVENCVFSQNIGESGGGLENFGFDDDRLQLNLRSCTFNGNRAEVGAAVSLFGGGVNLQATNTIFWGNTASDEGNSLSSQFEAIASLQNCLIEEENCGGISFNNTICRDVIYNQDPLFLDTVNHNLNILPCSPAVDNGVLNIGGTDFAGNPRIVGVRNDIGAYEVQTTVSDTLLFVNQQNINLSQDGTSWETAFSDLQSALFLANTCGLTTEIWVAAGTYFPTADTIRNVSFKLEKNLNIYGGFAGTESLLSERDFSNQTILSGNIGDVADSTDNSDIVLHITADVRLEHLTIRDGYSVGNGGGLMIAGVDTADVHILKCNILNNTAIGNGGGIALINNAQLRLEDSRINNNTATNFGGGLYRTVGTTTAVRNSFFLRNAATTGGAIYQSGNFFTVAEMSLVNCIIAQNTATNDGGAIFNSAATSTLINCTVADNQANNGAAIYSVSANDLTILNVNTIFANNTSQNEFVFGLQARGRFDYCLLSGYEDCPEGAGCEESIFGQSPVFEVTSGGNLYSIAPCSPALNQANQEIAPERDIYDQIRIPNVGIADNVADIGAVEQVSTGDFGGFSFVIQEVDCTGEPQGQITVQGNDDFVFPFTVLLNGNIINELTISAPETYLIDSLAAGTYLVEVIDINGCGFQNELVIEQDSFSTEISLEMTNSIACANSCTASINVVGDNQNNFTYQWNDGSTAQSRDSLCAGQYFLTVTDENGCITTDSIEIVQPQPIDIQFVVVNATNQQTTNGSIEITTTGGTAPYAYNWDNGIGMVQNPIDLAADIYNLTVTDANGCSAQISVEIFATGDAFVFQNIEINNLLCNADSTGSIRVNVSGGAGGYTFNWSTTEADTNELSNLAAGDYSLTVMDVAGTALDTTLTVSEPEILTYTMDVQDSNCADNCDGVAQLTSITGGTPSYQINWADGRTGLTITDLCAGNIQFIVTDANNCSITDSVQITAPDSLQVEIVTAEDTGAGDGVVFGDVSGGSPGYLFSWTDAAGNEIGAGATFVQNLLAGEYCLQVTDANGCSESTCATISLATNIFEINTDLDWKIYPVPALDEVQIELNSALQNDWHLELLDVNGRVLQQQILQRKTTTLPLETLPAGVYYIKITTANQLAIKRLMKI